MVIISDAPTAWNLLKGLVCLYKPTGVSANNLRQILIGNLCRDLCELECRPPTDHVFIEGKTTSQLSVHVAPSYADHPLVVGPRYQPEDFRCVWGAPLGRNVSGVFVVGLNEGTKIIHNLHKHRPTRVYRLKGLLGKATDDYFITGKVMEKATYGHVNRSVLDRVIAAMQAAHQKHMFQESGVDIQSQAAYELATQGLVKPANSKLPILYSIKSVDFKLPEFTIEVQCINEDEMYLRELIHDIGMQVHSVATCTALQCIRYDSFTLEQALLRKHWRLQFVLENIAQSMELLEQTRLKERKQSPTLQLCDNDKLKVNTVNSEEIKAVY